jgi:hypothetical protein
LLRGALPELIAPAAYTMTFALLESVMLMVVTILIAALLPARWMRDDFAVKGTGVLYASVPWMIVALSMETQLRYLYLLPLVGCLLSLTLFYKLLGDFTRIRLSIRALLDRISLLSYLYAAIDLLGLLVVVARNV